MRRAGHVGVFRGKLRVEHGLKSCLGDERDDWRQRRCLALVAVRRRQNDDAAAEPLVAAWHGLGPLEKGDIPATERPCNACNSVF